MLHSAFQSAALNLGLALGAASLLLALPLQAADQRVFELRTYTCHPGKLDDLHKRFSEHTNAIFVKHGMSLIAYWTPLEGPESENTLVYILAYPSMAAREASWKAFREDPAWTQAKEESEKDGPIVSKVEATFLSPTDYSPIR